MFWQTYLDTLAFHVLTHVITRLFAFGLCVLYMYVAVIFNKQYPS